MDDAPYRDSPLEQSRRELRRVTALLENEHAVVSRQQAAIAQLAAALRDREEELERLVRREIQQRHAQRRLLVMLGTGAVLSWFAYVLPRIL